MPEEDPGSRVAAAEYILHAGDTNTEEWEMAKVSSTFVLILSISQ